MAERNVEVEGINYHTIFELPDSQDKDAPCILLVHALMSNLHMYDSTIKALHKAGYSTLRYDHMGHHNTPPPQTATTQRRMSISGQLAYHMDDLTRHMHQLVKERTGQTHLAAVIGCSIGGVLALRYAMMFPRDVDQIISIAAPGIVYPEDKKYLWSDRIKQFESDNASGTDTLCHATVERWFPGPGSENEAIRAEALKHVKTCSLQGYKLLADTIRNYDYTDELHTFPMEGCLIVAGTEDGAISMEGLDFIAGYIQGSKLVKMEGAGHLPPMHQPREFEELILGYLEYPDAK